MAVHEVGDRAVLAPQHVADRGALGGGQEAVDGHPRVVEHRPQVAAAAVGQQHDDDGVAGLAA